MFCGTLPRRAATATLILGWPGGRDVTGDTALALADGWEETRYETGTYGPDGTPGLAAAFERDSMSLRVVPARYECEDGTEDIRMLTEDLRIEREGAVPLTAAADPQTAFATVAEYEGVSQRQTGAVCVSADAGDAIAVALWLAAAADTDRELRRAVTTHQGGGNAVVTDDDALSALFADAPERCIVTGRPTRSHEVTVPYRYYPLLAGARAAGGVPRFPSTVRALVGAVSHTAWEDHALDGVDFGAPIEREAPGDYRLHPAVAELMADAQAADVALERLA